MNLIFLDMDGVLNCQETVDNWLSNHKTIKCKEFKQLFYEDRPKGYMIDPILRNRLNEILTKVPNCKVVWSTSWRVGFRNSKRFIEGFYNKCKFVENSFIGATPIHHAGPRSEEIINWIKLFKDVYGPFEKIVIIDDDYDAKVSEYSQDELNQKCKFFQTDFKTGLTEEIKNNILVYFGVK